MFKLSNVKFILLSCSPGTELNDPWCELHSLKDLPEIGSFQIHIKWGLVEIEIPPAHPNNYLMSATDTLTKFVLEPGPEDLSSSQANMDSEL